MQSPSLLSEQGFVNPTYSFFQMGLPYKINWGLLPVTPYLSLAVPCLISVSDLGPDLTGPWTRQAGWFPDGSGSSCSASTLVLYQYTPVSWADLVFLMVMGIEPRPLCKLDEHSITELYPQPWFFLRQVLLCNLD
jgi:hypothetical protein